MQTSRGKLTNKDTGEALKFSLNPVDYRLNRKFDFTVQSCLGQSAPVVAFAGGGASQLSFNLRFDTDVDKDGSPENAAKFLKALNKLDETKRSTPVVEFMLGNFTFLGYVTSYGFQATRFDTQGNVVAAGLELTLISTGEYENGGQ
jgi:hypothetical protein